MIASVAGFWKVRGLGCAVLVCCSLGCGAQSTASGPKVVRAGSATSARSASEAKGEGMPPRPASAAVDVEYYRERAAALQRGALTEIARTDFVRFRHGRMYLPEDPKTEQQHEELGAAFEAHDSARILTVTDAILAEDQADIRTHILRAATLRQTGRVDEADFQKSVAKGLIESITQHSDGRSFDAAWTVFRVKEEYDMLQVLGLSFVRQSLVPHGARQFDVLEATGEEGDTVRVYFEITELFAEEARAMTGG